MIGIQQRRFLTMILFMLFGASLPLLAQVAFNVDRGKTFNDPIFAYKQTVNIAGGALQNVNVISADVYISGEARQNVNVLNGDVIILKGGKVFGNVNCLGGKIRFSDNAESQVMGKVTTLAWFGSDGDLLRESWYAKVAWYFAHGLLLFLLVILTFYIFPNQINEAGFELSQDLVRAAVVGAVTWGLFVLILFVCFVFMVVGVGYILFLLAACGMMAITVFGTVIFFYQAGVAIESLSKSRVHVTGGILLSVMVASLLIYLPILGELFILTLLLFGAGIVIDTRFGTNKQWFTRRSHYWSAD